MSVGSFKSEDIDVAIVPHIWFIASDMAESVISSSVISETLLPSPPIMRLAITNASFNFIISRLVPSSPFV